MDERTGRSATAPIAEKPIQGANPVEKEIFDCWSEEPSLKEDGGPLYHALSATSLLAVNPRSSAGPAEDPAGIYSSALGFLIALTRAERAFLFEAVQESPGSLSLGRVLASRNVDGEAISQPEKKAPQALLSRVLKAHKPVLSSSTVTSGETDASPGSALHGAALPIESVSRIEAVLYLENRFQPLEASRECLRLARTYALVLGSIVELNRVRLENDSLWADVSRFLEEKPRHVVISEPPRERPAARSPKRTDLKGDYSLIVGSSQRMLEMFQVLDRISSSNASVLINGESGTGKELIANAVHHNSPRRGKVFVSENCGALTETLLESELFGYVKGAFTGANKDHKGLFELAIGGTLFLDEVGDMSTTMQKKLLRVLQEGVIRRVGGKDYIPVDVRIISATNKDLIEEVKAGNFREDLYYRLNVINLKMPPLRERKEDIPALLEHFLFDLEKESGVKRNLGAAALERLTAYDWPGNIRELRNEVKRLHALSDGDIRIEDLSEAVLSGNEDEAPLHNLERQLSHLTLKEATERVEKELIRNALIQCRGNKSLMAKMLQVPKTSLYNKISKYGLDHL